MLRPGAAQDSANGYAEPASFRMNDFRLRLFDTFEEFGTRAAGLVPKVPI
jgi:hypothetical protein